MTVSTIKATGGDFSTLSGWEASLPATLSAPAEAECYDFDLNDTLGISGVTTSAANYIRIYTPTTERHDGRSRTVSGSGFRLKRTASSGTVVSVQVNHCRFEGLEIEAVDATTNVFFYSFGTFAAGANDHRVDHCIIHGTQTGAGNTVSASVANLNLIFRNNIVYGSNRSIDTRSAASAEISNCTFWRHADQLGILGDTELVTKNTYCGKASGTTEDFWTGGAAPSGSNNASSDSTASTDYTAGQTSVAGSNVFTSVTAGAEDFTLVAGTNALVDNGTTLAAVTDDIIGTARPQNSVYDIGAFERAAAGASTISGDLSVTFASMTVAAEGTLGPITAQAAVTFSGMTLSAEGALPIAGQAAVTFEPMTVAGEGALGAISGEAAITFADMSLQASGGDPNAEAAAFDVLLRARRRGVR